MFNEFFKPYLRTWLQHPLLQIGALTVLTGTFGIIFSINLLFANLERIASYWGSDLEMSIYLKENLKEDQVEEISQILKEQILFREVKYISKSQARDNFFSKMSKYIPDFAKGEDFLTVVPASFVGLLKNDVTIGEIQSAKDKIEKTKGIEEVSFGQGWLENFEIFFKALKRVGLVVSFILLLGATFVISFTIFSMIVRRREEIEIQELCGETSLKIQWPYIIEGFLMSGISSILGLAISYALLKIQNELFMTKMIYLGFSEIFRFYNIADILLLLFVSSAAGGIISWICVRKINSGWAAATRESL